MRTFRRILAASSLLLPALAVMATPSTASTATQPGYHGWKFDVSINAPWAHEGEEDVDSPLDAVGLCRSAPFNTTLAYAPTTDVDAIVNDPVNNSGASNLGCRTPQNETSIAVDPTDPMRVVAGANDYRVCCDSQGLNDSTAWAYASRDGGRTWTNVQVPGLTVETGGVGAFTRVDTAGDPALAFGPDGTLYYANIVFNRSSPASGIAVSVSHDAGLTWDAPVMVAFTGAPNFINDKEWVAVGPDGRVVVTWTRFDFGPRASAFRQSPIVMATSTDHGRSFSSWRPVSDRNHPYNQGSMPEFASDGTLYVAYETSSPATGYATDATAISRSTDGGQTFSTVEVGRVYDDPDCYPLYADRPTLSGEHFRLNGYPAFDIDAVTGRLAVAWADDQNAGSCGTGAASFSGTTSAQVKLVTGAWGALSAPRRVTIGSGDKVFPGVATRAGVVEVTYYTRDFAATHNPATCKVAIVSDAPGVQIGPVPRSVCLDYAASTSLDGFASERRLTSEGSNPYVEFANGAFIGDYTQAAFGTDGLVHAAWTDFRGRPGVTSANQDVYVATVTP